ncbi:MAG: hypothetical protein WCQ26_10095 [Pseudanabaena sp. ELA748]
MKEWQLKGIQWGFLVLLVAASPLILREVRKGGLARMQYMNAQPVAAQSSAIPIPRTDLENRYKRCYGLPAKTPIAFDDTALNNEVYACERSRN